MLDVIDTKILACLDENARTPLTQIAKKTKISTQLAKFRLERLEKKGIITSYYTTIDIAMLGYTSYRILVPLMNTNKEKYQEIINYIHDLPNILWLVNCGGRFDIIFNITARNPPHLDKQLKKILTRFPDQIKNYTIAATLSAHIFKRKFLYNSFKQEKEQYFGEEKQIIQLDKIDKQILEILSINARENAVKIANKLNISPNSVINRIKNLKKKRIIQGFKPLIHLEKIGYEAHKILVKLQSRNMKREQELFAYCSTHKNVTYFLKMVASWDIEIEPEVKNTEELQKFIMNLRDNFSDIIKDIEVIPLYHDYFYNYYPKE